MDSGKPPGQVKNPEARTLAKAPSPHLGQPLGVGKASCGAELRLAAG